MKGEIRNGASAVLSNMLKNAFGDKLIAVRVGNSNAFAIDLGMTDDETGKPVYGLVKISIPNTSDTKTTKAFDLGEAVQAAYDYENKPKKEKKVKEVDPEVEAKRARRNQQEQELEKWLLANLDGEMTATDIMNTAPGMAEVGILMVGTFLKNITGRNPVITVNVVKGKKFYSHA